MSYVSSTFDIDEDASSDGLITDPLYFSAAVSESGDAAANTGTSASMEVSDTFSGTIGNNGDVDWIAIDLVAGESYTFMVWGDGGQSAGLDDTYLRLYTSSGSLITWNDDIEPSYNDFSLIEYTATTTGTYYIAVSASGSETGAYTVQASDDVWSPEEVVHYLTDFGWGTSEALHFDVEAGDTLYVNISALTSDGQKLALWALEAWTIATGINFVTTTSSGADIIFDDNQSGAFAGPSSYYPETGEIVQATVNIGTGWLTDYGTTYDSYSLQTYIHEIGHALGLSHTGPYDGSADYDEDITVGDNTFINDSTQISIMSYFDGDSNYVYYNSFIDADPASIVTPMIADIAAMEYLYGGTSAYTGDTTWGVNNTLGGTLGALFAIYFDDASDPSGMYSGNPLSFTIFDTDGIDTLNLSGTSASQNIDMTEEGISDIYGHAGSMVIALNTIIENLVSGSGDDVIIANSANNEIDGGDGHDVVYIAADLSATAVTNLGGGEVQFSSAEGTDVLSNVEWVGFNDTTWMVDWFSNQYIGTGTALSGGSTNDYLEGTSSGETITANGGIDLVYGGGGADTIHGNDGDDFLFGDSGGDTIYGDAGNDMIAGNSGDDFLYGGTGNDNIGGGTGNDTIEGGIGDDTIGGGPGEDNIIGEDGNDFIAGGDDNDTLDGGADNDILNGGAGDDTMTGGTGADQFNFNELVNGETDIITDFEVNVDTIRITGVSSVGSGQQGYYDALSITDGGLGGVDILYGGHTIHLDDVTAAQLDVDDFLFL